jgi:hypothetical protein
MRKSMWLVATIIALGFPIKFAVAESKAKSKIVSIPFREVSTELTIPVESNNLTEGKLLIEGSVIRDFKVPDTLESEANSQGYTFSDKKVGPEGKHRADDFKVLRFTWGQVYVWNTPTRGSAIYSYACRTKEKFCFKIGPYSLLELNWSKATFKDLKK